MAVRLGLPSITAVTPGCDKFNSGRKRELVGGGTSNALRASIEVSVDKERCAAFPKLSFRCRA